MDATVIANFIQMNGMPSPDEQKHLARAYLAEREEREALQQDIEMHGNTLEEAMKVIELKNADLARLIEMVQDDTAARPQE